MRPRPALSTSPFAAELLTGPRRSGRVLGAGYVLFGDRVLAVTRPGALRMPNGIEADLPLGEGASVAVGAGELRTDTGAVSVGPLWNPRPRLRAALSVTPRFRPDFDCLSGRGPGLTPLGDDLLVGYLAGLALAGADMRAAATAAARRTTALSGTLLRLAAVGRLPEAAHRLLECGDPQPLLGFGATSGKAIAVGLALALDRRVASASTVAFTLPLPGTPTRFQLAVGAAGSRAGTSLLRDSEGSAFACMSSRR